VRWHKDCIHIALFTRNAEANKAWMADAASDGDWMRNAQAAERTSDRPTHVKRFVLD